MSTSITIVSFGYNNPPGPPRNALVVDVRHTPNPHTVPAFRPRSGLDRIVSEWVLAQPDVADLVATLTNQIHTTGTRLVAVGCNAGRHRSVAIANELGAQLAAHGYTVDVEHRDLKTKTKPKRTTSQAGLGWQHQKQRTRLLGAHRDGAPCWWCGRPMWKDHTRNWDYDPTATYPSNGRLAADHTHARTHGGTIADRLLHEVCNKERGDGSRDHLRPATHTPTPKPTTRNALDW